MRGFEHMHSKIVFFITALGLALILGACAAPATSLYREVSPATITPGSPIPIPSEEVILTISGDISVTNVGETLQLDMPTLESLGLVEYTVEDPWLSEEVTYTGVLMSKLSEFVGASESADNFHIEALDDYQVDLPFADIERWPILLATRSNGQYMAIENAGPTRIIFPYHSFKELDLEKHNDLWIWNIDSMQVN
jgi:hypothetical protein